MSSKCIGKINKIRIGKTKAVLVLDNKKRIEVTNEIFSLLNKEEGDYFYESDRCLLNEQQMKEKLLHYGFSIGMKSFVSKKKMKEKLISKGGSNKLINEIIPILEKEGIIDEENACKEYASYYHNKLCGINKIKKVLREKGYSSLLIDSLSYDEGLEKDLAVKLLDNFSKRYKDISKLSLKEKCFKKLVYNGFNISLVNEVIKHLDDEEEK